MLSTIMGYRKPLLLLILRPIEFEKPLLYMAIPSSSKTDRIAGEMVFICSTKRDKFGTWNDVVTQENSSPHLVKWITSGKQREAKRRMKIVTRVCMNRPSGGGTTESRNTSSHVHSDYQNMEHLTDCDEILSVDDALSVVSGCTRWECIDDTAIETTGVAPRSLVDDDDISRQSRILA